MGKRCPKCNYVAPDDAATACPACGVVYPKAGAAAVLPKLPSVEGPPAAYYPTQPAPPKKYGAVAGFTRVILGIVAVLSLLFGLGSAMLGTSAIHQILTAVYFLTCTVALSGLMVGETLRANGEIAC